jgi:hypothetical protein
MFGWLRKIRQKLSGHTTAEAHQRYTKLELHPLRKAINTIPARLITYLPKKRCAPVRGLK